MKMFLARASTNKHHRAQKGSYFHQHHGGRGSQTAGTPVPRLHRRQAVNVFMKCDLASICSKGSLMWPSGAGHQRTG